MLEILGPDAIAAAVTGQRVTFILQAVLTGVLAGSTALIARNWGARNKEEAGIFFTRTVQLVICHSFYYWSFHMAVCRAIWLGFLGLKGEALSFINGIFKSYLTILCGLWLWFRTYYSS